MVKNTLGRPYKEKLKGNVSIRKFQYDTDSDEFVWHRDRENRTIKVLNKTDWYFQVDNQLPIPLRKGFSIYIPEGVYHRAIKGTTDLEVKIIKHS